MAFRNKFELCELVLPCEWEECLFVGRCMEEFCNHISQHLKEYKYYPVEETEQCRCQWQSCEFLATNAKELAVHVNFHSHHTKLKFIGSRLRSSCQDLPECSQKKHSQNQIPKISETLVCYWEQCDLNYSNPEWFYRHVATHADSSEKEILQSNKKTFCCHWKDCAGKFQGRYKLWDHLRTHTGERVVACPSCGLMFYNKSGFLDHSRRSLPEDQQLFICQKCRKHFANKRLLNSHMRIHIPRVACPYCELLCTSISSLKVHVRFRHSEERPFCCNVCSKGFKSTCDLRKHVETHNSSALYRCEMDGCVFTSRTLRTLRQHNKRTHEKKGTSKYKCHLCQKCFAWCYTLTLHLRKVHKLRCNSRFQYKEDGEGYLQLKSTKCSTLVMNSGLQNQMLPERSSLSLEGFGEKTMLLEEKGGSLAESHST